MLLASPLARTHNHMQNAPHNEDTTGSSGQAFSLNTLNIGLFYQMCGFFDFWYYMTLWRRLISSEDGGTHLR